VDSVLVLSVDLFVFILISVFFIPYMVFVLVLVSFTVFTL